MATVSEQIQQIYIGLLGRAADLSGLNYWTDEIDQARLSIEQLRANIVNEQPEYAAGLGSMSRASVVVELYSRLFNRIPDDSGLTYWAEGGGASVNVDQLILALSNGASVSDNVILSQKTAAAETYTQSAGENYNATDAANAVKGDGTEENTVPGITAALTDADATGKADELQGTDGNDTFTATAGILDSDATLDSEDTLADNNLNDKDVLTIEATTDITEMASLISGIEAININLSTLSSPSIDLSGIAGFGTTITINNLQESSDNSVTLLNIPGSATVVIGSAIVNTLTATVDSRDATIDARSVSNVQLNDMDKSGTTLIVNDGATVSLDGTASLDDATTLKATGNVTIESASTDQLEELTLSGNGSSVVYTLDSTDDLPTKLVFTGSDNVSLALNIDQLGALSSSDQTSGSAISSIRLTAGGTADLTALDVDIIELSDSASAGTYNLAQQQGVLLSSDLATAITLDALQESGNEILDLQLASNQTGDINVSDFEIINLTTVSDPVVISTLTANALTSIVNLTGSQNITLTSVTAKGVNANNLSGNLAITLSETLRSVTGGSGDDTFTLLDGDLALNGGAGTDTLLLNDALDLSDDTIDISNIEVIQIADDAESIVTMNASELNDKTISLKGTGTKDTLDLIMDEASLDLSNFTVEDATAQIFVTSSPLTTHQLLIIGSQGNDTITGNDADDILTPGEGADRASGAAGNDRINLAEITAAADTVVISSVTEQGVDTIDGFSVQEDIIAWQASDLTAAASATSGNALTLASTATALNSSGGSLFTLGASSSSISVIELTTTLDDDVVLSTSSTGSDLLQALSQDATLVSGIQINATGEKVALVTYQNNNAYLWHLSEGRSGSGTGDTTVLADDILLVGVMNDITAGDLSSSNFVVA